MTVSSTTNRVSYTGNGATTAFAFPYAFQAQADLKIIETVIATGVQTTKVLGSDYTISGTTDANGYYPNGGTVNAVTAPANTVTWTIYRDPAATQLVEHVDNDPLPASSIDGPLDKLTMLVQRTRDLVTRALRQPDGDSANIAAIPPKVTRANGGAGSYAGYDSNGDPTTFSIPLGGTSVPVSVAMTPVVEAADLATARSNLGVPLAAQADVDSGTAGKVVTADLLSGHLAHGQCRLSVQDSTHIILKPFNGRKLVINGKVCTIPSAGVTVDTTGLASSTAYYLYAADTNADGTVDKLEFSTTGHATDATTGVETKSGDATRTLVGMVCTNGSTQFVDSTSQRFCINWFNRRPLPMAGSGIATLSTTSTSFANAGGTMSFLCWADSAIVASASGVMNTNNTSAPAALNIGLNSPSNFQVPYSPATQSTSNAPIAATADINAAEGLNSIFALAQAGGGGATAALNCAMTGWVWG